MGDEVVYPIIGPSLSPNLPLDFKGNVFRLSRRLSAKSSGTSTTAGNQAPVPPQGRENVQRPERLAPIPPTVTLTPTSRNRSKTLPSQRARKQRSRAFDQPAHCCFIARYHLPSAVLQLLWLQPKTSIPLSARLPVKSVALSVVFLVLAFSFSE